jgi:hypothetical protein
MGIADVACLRLKQQVHMFALHSIPPRFRRCPPHVEAFVPERVIPPEVGCD